MTRCKSFASVKIAAAEIDGPLENRVTSGGFGFDMNLYIERNPNMEKHPSMIKAYCNVWSEIFPTPSVWWYSIILPTSISNLWFPESITSTLLLPIPQNTAQNLWNGTHATRLMRTPNPRPKKPGQCRQGRSKQGLTRCTHLNRPGLVRGEGGWVVEGVSRKSGAKWNTEIKTGDYWFLEMRHDCNDMWWNDKNQ